MRVASSDRIKLTRTAHPAKEKWNMDIKTNNGKVNLGHMMKNVLLKLWLFVNGL
jgi:hypothetical protein